MAQYILKSAVIAEIEDWRDKIRKGIFDIPLTGSDRAYATFEYEILGKIKDFIDTLEVKEVQEEPINRKPADIESAMQEVEEKSRAFTEAHQGENTDNILAQMRGEKPVSEDLGKVGSLKSLEYYPEKKTTNKTSKGVFDANMPRRKAYLRGFKDGAHAHKELIANKPVSNDLKESASQYPSVIRTISPQWESELENAFKAGAKWQKASLWKPADGDLPEIDREVIVLVGIKNPVTTDSMWGCEVAFAHRPNPNGWDGKSITTGEVEHYEAQTYGKGGWNIPDVKFWLDCNMDSIFKRNNENNKIDKR